MGKSRLQSYDLQTQHYITRPRENDNANQACKIKAIFTLYRIPFRSADTKSYPVWCEQQRHRTRTSRSDTSNIKPERV